MSVALLDSVRHAEGSRGVQSYVREKLSYMPAQKPRKAIRSTQSALDAVRRVLEQYLEQRTAFSIRDLCEDADVSSSWLYNDARADLRAEIEAAQSLVGKRTSRKRLQASPPEPEPDTQAIAQQWLDAQIESHKQQHEIIQQRQAELEQAQQQCQEQLVRLEASLSHLFKVRAMTQIEPAMDKKAATDDGSDDGSESSKFKLC